MVFIVNIALNYDGRLKYKCYKKIGKSNNEIRIDEIDETIVESLLYTTVLIGIINQDKWKLRSAIFIMAVYIQGWFTDIYWPDFKGKHLFEAISDYQNRKRRFGGI